MEIVRDGGGGIGRIAGEMLGSGEDDDDGSDDDIDDEEPIAFHAGGLDEDRDNLIREGQDDDGEEAAFGTIEQPGKRHGSGDGAEGEVDLMQAARVTAIDEDQRQ